jgi:hypothetical protein
MPRKFVQFLDTEETDWLQRAKWYADCVLNFYWKFLIPLNYCCTVWGNMKNKEGLYKLCKLQKRAARIILNKSFYTPTTEMMQQLRWMPISDYFIFRTIILVLGACRLPICDGMGHPANVATCARMALCPISFKIHNSIHLNSNWWLLGYQC